MVHGTCVATCVHVCTFYYMYDDGKPRHLTQVHMWYMSCMCIIHVCTYMYEAYTCMYIHTCMSCTCVHTFLINCQKWN